MRRLLLILCCMWSVATQAQDIHASQFVTTPLVLNPAFTGANNCDYRAGINYKAQYGGDAALGAYTFNTINAFADVAVGKKAIVGNFAGVGLNLYSDRAGDANFAHNKVEFSAAYHFTSDRRAVHLISFGLQGGLGFRSADETKMTFNSQFDRIAGFDPFAAGENLNLESRSYADIHMGMMWTVTPNNGNNFNAGLSVQHINRPFVSLAGEFADRSYVKMNIHASAKLSLDKLAFLPSMLIMTQGPYREYNVGGYVQYSVREFQSKSTAAIAFGTWYRFQDAFVISARFDIENFSIAASYDINSSGLAAATNSNGGPEISIIGQGCISKSLKKKRRYFCPTL